MSYTTVYNLYIEENRRTNFTDDQALEQAASYLHDADVLSDVIYDSYESSWTDHERDMKGLSYEIYDVVFCLHGEGEDRSDVWDKYFLNGKMQRCYATMTIPEFDEEKLT